MMIMEAYDTYIHHPEETDEEQVEYLIYDDGYIDDQPHWTRRRMIWLVIALLIITAMILVLILPLMQTYITPIPSYIPPPATPPSQL